MARSLRLLLVLGLVVSAIAQVGGNPEAPLAKTESIDIGAVPLRLGMARDMTVSRLQATHKLVRIQGEGDTWMIQDKADPNTLVGSLKFVEGKLTYVSRRWAQGSEDSYNFAQALRGAMAARNKEGYSICSFDVPMTRTPQAEWSYVDFYCGPKRIEISMTNVLSGTGKGLYVSIDEVLSSENER